MTRLHFWHDINLANFDIACEFGPVCPYGLSAWFNYAPKPEFSVLEFRVLIIIIYFWNLRQQEYVKRWRNTFSLDCWVLDLVYRLMLFRKSMFRGLNLFSSSHIVKRTPILWAPLEWANPNNWITEVRTTIYMCVWAPGIRLCQRETVIWLGRRMNVKT